VWGIARLVTHRRWVAYAASLIYVTNPAVLLNGRRAMMEGSHLGFVLLAVLVAFVLLRCQSRQQRLWGWYTAFGAASGLAVASKHNVLLTLAVMFAVVGLNPILGSNRLRLRRDSMLRLGWAVLVLIVVFLLLNPAWWSDLLGMPGRVTRARVDMLDAQVQQSDHYGSFGDQVEGLIKESFFAKPQFYEVQSDQWEPYISEERDAYDDSPMIAGRRGGPVWGLLLILSFAVGLIALVRRWRTTWMLLLWLSVVALALVIATPLPWQRYYLPLQAPLAIVEGVGLVWIADLVKNKMALYRHSPTVSVRPQSQWISTAIVLVGALMLISHACDVSMRSGETRTIFHSAGTLDQILSKDQSTSWPPAYFVLLHGWMKIAGKSELAVHMINILAGLLGIACMIRAGQSLHSRRAGWLAGLAFATSGYAAYFFIEVRGYGLVLALVPALIWVHARWLRYPSWWEKALPLVLVQTALLYSHYGNALALIILTGLWTVFSAPPRVWTRWFILVVVSGLLFLPQWSAAWDYYRNIPSQNSSFNLGAWYQAYSAHQDILWAVIMLLALIGIGLLIRQGTRQQRLMVFWLALWGIGIPLVAYLLLDTSISSLVFTTPAVLLLVGIGLAQLPRGGLLAGSGLLLIFLIVPWQPFDHRPSESPLRDSLRTLADQIGPSDTLVIDPALTHDDPATWWYYEQIYFPGRQPSSMTGEHVWYLTWREGRTDISLYERPPQIPGLLLGDRVRFRGYALPDGTLYRPGDRLHVQTWWSVDQTVERDDYSIGLYLLDGTGMLVSQVDSGPTGPLTPANIAQWQPDNVYRDDRGLRLPTCLPTGAYQVRMAIYGWQDGVRLLPEEGDGLLLLDTIHVVSEANCE
jgi:hypothetical protein